MKRNIKGKKKEKWDSKEKFCSGASDPKHTKALYIPQDVLYILTQLFIFIFF